ncbi:uncharacterized protein CMU_005650 [Cryptosporidium muris RN66]|uniref:Uncharacterized protein n=1 Tax=Cryptosporidium muris (strain RN66) TaxID=441375 RepID=B6AHE7_CRYMR|nr:uncharacterized protein CMU_005650 [Cryptosporidium muris RN66]EEA07642.1 hypothetical protein, conserved [Cryptosporidium muris RN66]|eukprot:XP_002141991.1 hypothetical protein [Cryptosporidium muris RN66]
MISSTGNAELTTNSQFTDPSTINKVDPEYRDYINHLQNSTTALRRENSILKNDNAALVAKLDRVVSSSRSGIKLSENATTAEISEAFDKLSSENILLKREMERLIRDNNRCKIALQNNDPSILPKEYYNTKLVEPSSLKNIQNSNQTLCQCEYILNELFEAVTYKLESYEKHIWEHRMSSLMAERDELAVQNMSLTDRLAEIEAIIKVDHILAERFNRPLEGTDEKNQILTLHRKLGFALDVNQQLERRLAFESQLSRSWQSNMHTIVSELRQYLYELGAAIRNSNGCGFFRSCGEALKGTRNNGNSNVADDTLNIGIKKSDRESLRLLRLAKQRIEADAKRLETCNKRIIELENEVASLRVRNHTSIYQDGAMQRAIQEQMATSGTMNKDLQLYKSKSSIKDETISNNKHRDNIKEGGTVEMTKANVIENFNVDGDEITANDNGIKSLSKKKDNENPGIMRVTDSNKRSGSKSHTHVKLSAPHNGNS